MNGLLLQNSLVVSACATVLAGAIGLATALALATAAPRWRKGLLSLVVVALALPPFLVTNTWLSVLGLGGAWRGVLPVEIQSLAGASWILALMHWPITTLLALAAWRRLEAAHLESDPALRGGALLRWLLWPMARGAAGQAAMLTFVLALNNFAVPALLQVKVFPAEVWVKFETNRDFLAAFLTAWPMIVAPMVLLLWLRTTEWEWPRTESRELATALRRQLGRPWLWGAVSLGGVVAGLSVVLPLGQILFSARTWAELPNLLRAAPGTVWNSALYAVGAATVAGVLGLLGARHLRRAGRGVWLPLLTPGVLLGIGVIHVFNRPVLDTIYPSAALVIATLAVRHAAIGWGAAALALRGLDRNLIDAARLEGASGWALWRHAIWPQIAAPVLAAWYVAYLLCLWDVETLVLIQPPGGETLALRAFNLLHYGHNAQVNAHGAALLALGLAPMVIWHLSQWLRRTLKAA